MLMHVLQATAWYPPHSVGGTEIYLQGLVSELQALGVRSTVLTPGSSQESSGYNHLGVAVETYPVNVQPLPREFREEGLHADFDVFESLLSNHHSAIYHQHSWTRGCGPHHLQAAHERGLRTILTVHLPGVTCLRGTMLRFGKESCDGKAIPERCGACWAEARGLPRLAADMVGRFPASLAARARTLKGGAITTMLSARDLAAQKLTHIRQMFEHADRIVAVCQWVYDALLANGAPKERLLLSRQGIEPETLDELLAVRAARVDVDAQPQPFSEAGSRGSECILRLLLLARWDPVKGIDIAVRAVRMLPAHMKVELRICAVPSAAQETYEHYVRKLAADDHRIVIDEPVRRNCLASSLRESDVLVCPSTWLETGPLVVLEAQAAGLFVLGSRRGGIAELVDACDGGMLVEPGDVAAWAEAISTLVHLKRQGRLQTPKRAVRSMATVASEMAQLYGTF